MVSAVEELKQIEEQKQKLLEREKELKAYASFNGLYAFFRGRDSFLADLKESEKTEEEKFKASKHGIVDFLQKIGYSVTEPEQKQKKE